jgi:hypothetical protein
MISPAGASPRTREPRGRPAGYRDTLWIATLSTTPAA